MLIHKAYKYRIFPTNEQQQNFLHSNNSSNG
ncbi:helix-turn-helix domain-containing protein [Paenibacillus borealis]